MNTRFTVNGCAHELYHAPDHSLLSALREDLGLTGTKYGCGEGECSACAVLVGSREVRSCVTPLASVANQQVTTVEGLAEEGYLHPVQQAFLEVGAFQCGYCTPGWITGTAALLQRFPHPSDGQIATELAGHACRCCTYPRILRAVHRAAELLSNPELVEDVAPLTSTAGELWDEEQIPWDLTLGDDRDFFTILGDGLVCVVPPEYDIGRAELASKPNRRVGGTWVHCSPEGRVTAFTGKVEIGQGTRTALALFVAEELRVEPTSVVMVMGDTAVSPYDAGTSGSRSMIEIGECLRAAGAVARETILSLASGRLELRPEELTTSHGWVMGRNDQPRIAWGGVLNGIRHLVRIDEPAPVTCATEWNRAGKATLALNGADIVTGRKRYPYDVVRPGMFHGQVLRPPSFKATLVDARLDESKAEGVTLVREDNFVGVIARTPSEARAAISAIEAEWKTIEQPGEAELEAHLRAHPIPDGWQNIALHRERGDIEIGLTGASQRLSATYRAAYIAHVPLEPRSAVAEWHEDRLTVWTGTQRPFPARKTIAEYFALPEDRVRVIVPDFGSGFGGKHLPDAAIEAARLARSVGRPVRLQWSRAEEFTWAYFRPAAVIDVDAGLDEAGQLVAWRFENINSGPAGIKTPYEIEHQLIDYQPADSPLAHGSYRALAATANNFARESHMDGLAALAGLNPLQFRLRHLHDDRLIEVLRAAAHRIGWDERERSSGLGVGIACSYEKSSYVATAALVRVDERRALEILRLVTAFECGAIVNPDNVTNQVEGATVMALGGALFEAIHFTNGAIINGSLAQYRVPRLGDVPPIEVILLERKDLPSVGASETPMVAVAPAIGNAIFDATGTRLRSLPLIPEGMVPIP